MPLLEVSHLVKEFTARSAPGARPHSRFAWRTRRETVRAVADVSFAIEQGEMFGLVGESGSGKTTTGRCVLRLIPATSGEVRFRGEDVLAAPAARMRELRCHMQPVFQDPFASLNPRMRVGAIVEEPLVIHRVGTRDERRARVEELLRLVDLPPDASARYPHAFSGGQRQRIGLARALALNPSFLVADEPVSALDVSVQAQIVDLLTELQRRLGLTCLFITHDLRLVEKICPRLAVMYRGRIVEMGPAAAIFACPAHPYTKALLSAVPVPDPDRPRTRLVYEPHEGDETLPLRDVATGHQAAV